MDVAGALTQFRSDVDDVEKPYLWTDLDFVNYVQDAQVMFCRLTEGISDATTPLVAELDVVPTDEWLATHPSIIKFRGATRADTGRTVEILNEEDLAPRGWFYDGVAGTVKALVIGIEDNKVRLYPVSNETVTIKLSTFRLPLVEITEDNYDGAAFEVAAKHHLHLLKWVKHLAYAKQDAETFDRTKSANFENEFRAYCDQVKQEQGLARHKHRSVAYGGIPM